MTAFGISNGWEALLQNLDPDKLHDLLHDILAAEGHKDIRITNGPGDGERDVHSIDHMGNKWLSQSKFHSEIRKTVTSKETGELPLGMLKKGYSNGIFITNARISPQAKSEFLDDYRGYNLRFFDGLDIVKKVHDDIILKAIWYDGGSIDTVNYVLTVPIIIRDLERDKPISIQDKISNIQVCIGRSNVEFQFVKSPENVEVFYNYRPPSIKTISECASTIFVTETLIKGRIHLEDIDAIIKSISNYVFEKCHEAFPTKFHLALLTGKPYFTIMSGDSSGQRLPLDYPPLTIVFHEAEVEQERKWLLPESNSAWIFPDTIQASTADWIRWYNHDLNCCLDLGIICQPSEESRRQIEEKFKHFLKSWNGSLFFLISEKLKKSWEAIGIPAPDQWHQMDNCCYLAVWFDSNLTHSHLYYITELEDDEINAEEESSEILDVPVRGIRIEELRQKLLDIGGQQISPEKGRYLIGYLDKDPFPRVDIIEYRSIDLVMNYGAIPTPIFPSSRKIRFTVCWRINGIVIKNYQDLYKISEIVESEMKGRSVSFNISFEYDEECLSQSNFFIANLNYMPIIGQEKTDSILQNIHSELYGVLQDIEKRLKSFFIVERATLDYWTVEIGIRF